MTTLTLPGGARVPCWGFALDSAFGRGDGAVTIPGPVLTVPSEDTTLTIRLENNLPQPVSLIIPALPARLAPVYFGAAPYPPYQGRVRSLDKETPPGNTSPVVYSWAVKPGSYLYHSGTNMACQVQMGLAGAVKKDFTRRMAYPGVPYDQETILFYSEIDPDLHRAVAAGQYGPGKPVTSAMGSRPRYFLVNGKAYASGANATTHAAVRGRRLLVRMFNGGLRTRVPALLGETWSLVAEDGNLYPHPKEQFTAPLPAGKALDALLVPPGAAKFPIFDRTLSLVNDKFGPGGYISYVTAAENPGGRPVAKPNVYATKENTTLNVLARVGVLNNDINPAPGTTLAARLATPPAHGTLTLRGDGSFTYVPEADWSGADQFTYFCSNGLAESAPATAYITVSVVDDPPVTTPKHYTTKRDGVLTVTAPGIMTGDRDPEGKTLTAALVSPPAAGTLNSLNPDGSFVYTAAAGYLGNTTFVYRAGDGLVDSAPTTVTIKMAALNALPAPGADHYTLLHDTVLRVPASAGLLANDADPDGDTLQALLTHAPVHGTLQLDPAGGFQYIPSPGFAGKDSFEYRAYDGQTAARALVTITVLP